MSEGEAASEVTHPSYGGSPFYSTLWYDDQGEVSDFDLSTDGFSSVHLAGGNTHRLGTGIGMYDSGCPHQNEWNVDWRSTDNSFDRAVNAIRNDIHDPRWRCASWNDHVDRIVGMLHDSYVGDFEFNNSPTAMLPRYNNRRVYIAWRSARGGGAVFCADFGANEMTCLECEACLSHNRFHVERVGGRNQSTNARSVYFVQGVGGGPVKIGHSASPSARLTSLQVGSPSVLRVVATMRGGFEVERTLHRAFAKDRLHGEWFDPSRELMAFIDEISRKGSAQ